ncbi:hypothetical protein L2U69_12735 [Zavarzinia compransoris]|uniref:hypothetical protein n=1 Tax=Zavarzinia marina TaxID=2911065 RepID=UPI001F2338D0|nr:hypothetical protein [Zavarzinia marina]MCF4166512.1 hypothetical protein [Zavarzinia marina]
MHRMVTALFLTTFLAGCGATGIVASDDPMTKLRQARYLYLEAGRPAQAEPLIHDAMAAFQRSGDTAGQAEAHREFAMFLATPGSDAIIVNTAAEQPPVPPERLAKALAEMREASRLAESAGRYDILAGTSLGEARIRYRMGDIPAACATLHRSLDASEKFSAAPAEMRAKAPPGWDGTGRFVTAFRAEFGCPP